MVSALRVSCSEVVAAVWSRRTAWSAFAFFLGLVQFLGGLCEAVSLAANVLGFLKRLLKTLFGCCGRRGRQTSLRYRAAGESWVWLADALADVLADASDGGS